MDARTWVTPRWRDEAMSRIQGPLPDAISFVPTIRSYPWLQASHRFSKEVKKENQKTNWNALSESKRIETLSLSLSLSPANCKTLDIENERKWEGKVTWRGSHKNSSDLICKSIDKFMRNLNCLRIWLFGMPCWSMLDRTKKHPSGYWYANSSWH